MPKQVEEEYEESVNFKKILASFIFVGVIVIGGVFIVRSFMEKNPGLFAKPSGDGTVAGATTKDDSNGKTGKEGGTQASNEDLQRKLDTLKGEVSGLSVSDVTSSNSPQMKKVMEDIKNLQNLPGEQAKAACEQICRSL